MPLFSPSSRRALQGTSQAVQASLRGLSIRTLTTLVTAGPVAAPSVVAPAPGQAGALLHVRTKSFSGMGSSGATSGCGQGAAGGAAQPPSSRSGSSSSHALSSSTVTCTVLEPCDITLAVKMKEPVAGAGEAAGSSRVTGEVEEGSNNGTGGQMDVSLDVSDVVLKLSPDVLQLVVAVRRNGACSDSLVVHGLAYVYVCALARAAWCHGWFCHGCSAQQTGYCVH